MTSWFEHDPIPSGSTVAETGLLLERVVRELGLDRFVYAKVAFPRGRRPNEQEFAAMYSTAITNYPLEYGDRYVSHNYALDDPYIARSSREVRPFLWSADMHPRNARQRQQFNDLQDFGITNGLVIPVRGADGALGMFKVAAPDPEHVREAVRHGGGRLLAAAWDIHEFAAGRMPGEGKAIDDPGLSMRERECLLWTLEGKTAQEVAEILGLSVYTVNRHAFNAMRKLGGLNKHHAAIQAFRRGLL